MAPDHTTQTAEATQAPVPPTQPAPVQGHYHPQGPNQASGYDQYPLSYGQAFQPYEPAPQALPAEQRMYQHQQERFQDNKPWALAKDIMHGVGVVLSIVGLGVSLSLIGHFRATIAAAASGPVFVVALVWSGAELITRLVRKFKAGIHPGAHVALSLILWLAAAVAGGLEAAFAAIDSDSDSYYCWDYDSQLYDDDCDGPFDGRRAQFVASAAITCIVAVLHFVLFVGACADTSRRNAHAKRPVMIVSGGPPYWGPVAQGWHPVSQQREQKQQNIPMQMRGADSEAAPAMQEVPLGESSSRQPEGLREYYSPSGGR